MGLERRWSGHADGPAARFAGIRTFTMLGAVGGVSGWLWMAGAATPAAILLAGAVAVVAAAYVAGSRQDIDGTTEVAALVVLAAGLLSGMGSVRLASGIIALLTLLLVEKSRLHALVQRIDRAISAPDPRAVRLLNARVAREVDASTCEQGTIGQSLAGIVVGDKNRCIRASASGANSRLLATLFCELAAPQGQSWGHSCDPCL